MYNLVENKEIETWNSHSIEINSLANIWLGYNEDDKSALLLYLEQPGRYKLERFCRSINQDDTFRGRYELGQIDCNLINAVCENKGMFFFASQFAGDALSINVASAYGIATIQFIMPTDHRI